MRFVTILLLLFVVAVQASSKRKFNFGKLVNSELGQMASAHAKQAATSKLQGVAASKLQKVASSPAVGRAMAAANSPLGQMAMSAASQSSVGQRVSGLGSSSKMLNRIVPSSSSSFSLPSGGQGKSNGPVPSAVQAPSPQSAGYSPKSSSQSINSSPQNGRHPSYGPVTPLPPVLPYGGYA